MIDIPIVAPQTDHRELVKVTRIEYECEFVNPRTGLNRCDHGFSPYERALVWNWDQADRGWDPNVSGGFSYVFWFSDGTFGCVEDRNVDNALRNLDARRA